MNIIEKSVKEVFSMDINPSIMANAFEFTKSEANLMQQIPRKKEGYIFRRDLMRDILAWHNGMLKPLYLYGPTQCGKTSVLNQFANRLGIPVWSITGHRQLELAEMLGQYGLNENGGYIWMDGPLTQAAKNGGWFMVNELDRMAPTVLVGLNDILEMGDFTLSNKQGEIVKIHPNFRIVCTGNTNLAGDEGGNYNTASIHDTSVPERFAMMLQVDYPDEKEERALLEDVFKDLNDDDLKLWFSEENIKVENSDKTSPTAVLEGEFVNRESFIAGLLRVTNMVRNQSIDGGSQSGAGLERTISTATLLKWAQMCITFRGATKFDTSPLHYALERSLTNGCTPTTKVVIHEIVKSVFGVDLTPKTTTI
jgi:cobaltochelatase CobS